MSTVTRPWLFLGIAGLLAISLVWPASASSSDPSFSSSLAQVSNATDNLIAERGAFGLPTDPVTLLRLTRDAQDVGTADWGMPMTAAEEAEVDMPGRTAFADQVARTVLPAVRSWPTYGGAWIEQRAGGSLVVALTTSNDQRDRPLRASCRPSPKAWRSLRSRDPMPN